MHTHPFLFFFIFGTVLNQFCKCVIIYQNKSQLKIRICWELESWKIQQKEKSGLKTLRSCRENGVGELTSMVFISAIIRKDIINFNLSYFMWSKVLGSLFK